jgi:hypothetical protein
MQKPIAKTLKRRTARRNLIEATVTCRPYVSDSAVRSEDGVMRNFSGSGSYIETCRTFKPGTILIVRMLRYPPLPSLTAEADQPRSMFLAEVKWQQELGAEDPNRYGIGLIYLH